MTTHLALGLQAGDPHVTMTSEERVRCAIAFRQPDRVPVVFWNRDQTSGDIMLYHLSLGAPGDGTANAWDW